MVVSKQHRDCWDRDILFLGHLEEHLAATLRRIYQEGMFAQEDMILDPFPGQAFLEYADFHKAVVAAGAFEACRKLHTLHIHIQSLHAAVVEPMK
mmetsp:Transcript_8802/g.54079  ORF Transcript_8802/g.54079 Transcript_8802/m.54079 type:complete len:95 (+) Transcript_8802:379-663(+)